MNLFTQLRPKWHEASPAHLLDAPTTVLKAIDETRAEALHDVLGVRSVRDMATQPLVEWVWRTFLRFRAGAQEELPADAAEYLTEPWLQQGCKDWLVGPLSSLKALDAEQQRRLEEALGWATVRHMANDKAFETAREISRMVTGQPAPPDQGIVRPVPDYFSGGTQRFLARVREAGGMPQRPPAPPPPPPAAPAPAPAAPELPVEGDLVPAVAATLRTSGGSPLPQVPVKPHRDYTPQGAYVPHGGGSRGWVGNQGVPHIERPNHYRYGEAVDTRRFQQASLEDLVRSNNRGADRKEVRQRVRWSLEVGDAPSAGMCLNLSLSGARLRLSRAMRAGATLRVTWVHRDEVLGSETPLMALTGVVVWCKPAGASLRNSRHDCGIEFDALSLDTQERLALLLTERTGELLERGAPEPLPGD